LGKRLHSRIYIGWWMNLLTSMLTGFSQAFAMQGASALFNPISEEFNLSRAGASATSGITAISNGVGFLLGGWLSDRYGPKRVIMSGTIITSLSLLTLGASPNPQVYFALWGVSAFGVSLGYTVAVDALVTNWFRRRRGAAFSVRFAVIGLVSSLTLPILNWLISTRGWRISVAAWGGLLLASMLPLSKFLIGGGPEDHGLLPDGSPIDGGGLDNDAQLTEAALTMKGIFRTRAYWILTASFILYNTIFQGINIHIIPSLIDMGIDPITAGNLLALTTLSMIPSRLLSGFIADKIKPGQIRFVMSASLLIWSSSIVAYLLMPKIAGVYVFLILWGFGSGAYIPLDLIIRSRFFGRETFGRQQGLSSMISAPFTLFAPIYTGWMYDTTGSYATPFTIFSLLTLMSALTICLASPPNKTAS